MKKKQKKNFFLKQNVFKYQKYHDNFFLLNLLSNTEDMKFPRAQTHTHRPLVLTKREGEKLASQSDQFGLINEP